MQKLRSTLNRSKQIVFIVIFATVGVVSLIISHAVNPTASIEPEDSSITGNAQSISDSTASGNKALQFGKSITNTSVVRAMFYYPWFKETWGPDQINPFTNFHPIDGYYDDNNSNGTINQNLFDKQIGEMTYAGMDAAIASWWGPEGKYPQSTHKENTRIPALLNSPSNNSNGKQLKWSLYYEMESVGDPTVASITADLDYINTNYANHSNYLKINGKPVIFVFEDNNDACAMATRWTQANNASVGFYIVLKVFSGYATCTDQPGSWHQYGPALATQSQIPYSYTISPGYWKKGDPAVQLPRLSDATWGSNIDAMKASNAQFQLVTSFNEWGEGHSVEPATEWQSTSSYGSYIDILHQKLSTAPPIDNAPSVTITNPANGATVNGIVQVKFLATDTDQTPVNTSSVKVTLDGSSFTAIATGNTNEYAYNWDTSALTSGSTHTITVSAADTASKSTTSSPITVIKQNSVCSGNPTAPSSINSNLAASTIVINWGASTPAASCTLASYQIWRVVGANPATLLSTVSASTLSYIDTSYPYSSSLKYYVIALDSASPPHQSLASANSTITSPSCSDVISPTIPGNFMAVSTTTSVALSWTASTDSSSCGMAGYKIYRVINSVDTEIGTVLVGSSLSFSSTGLSASTQYTFRIKAYDSSSAVNLSAAASVTTTTSQPSSDIILVAAGDVQKPRSDLRYGIDTANIIKNQIKPTIVILPGDVQYESGALNDYNSYFDKTWGGNLLGSRIYPSPGNHDYGTSGAAGYFSYFNATTNSINGNPVTGPAGSGSGWYAFDAGSNWRIYSLNSETAGSTANTQNTFLANDMSANPKACSIFFDHKPYYDYGTTHTSDGSATLPWYKTFYSNNGEVVITGHEHNYQRFQPVNPTGDVVDTNKGLQTFVVGTGGADNKYTTFGATLHGTNSLISKWFADWGVLKMTLHSGGYDWEFIPISVGGNTDSGSALCH